MHIIWFVLVLLVLSSSIRAGTLGDLTYAIADGQVTITNCDGAAEGELVLPNEIEGLFVISIGREAFQKCTSLTSITIPDSVTSIGDFAFSLCSSLTSIPIPGSVTTIGASAFWDCSSLTSITIPAAFHTQSEAKRLSLDRLWPDGFYLPSNATNPPAAPPAQLSLRMVPAITVTGEAGQTATIEVSHSADGPWTEWRTVPIGLEGKTEIDLSEGADKRFYRVK